ncbi:MAG: gliding motility-associated C-terminal domain-containing protein [Saprospiraceae bacterium]|nr:gliding motility-associated C-terminal domain-containing protein [Saprospiraceae bacterium]
MILRKSTLLTTLRIILFIGLTQHCIAQIDTLELTVSSGMGETGTQVCLDVTSKNFTNIESIQFNLSYNSTLVVPECPARYIHPLLLNNFFGIDIFNCLLKEDGYINFVWASDPTTIPDGEVLFTLCFDLIGNAGNVSPVYFNGLLLDLEICNVDQNGKTVCTDQMISNVGTIMIKSNTLTAFYNKCDADGVNNFMDAFITFYATGGTPPYSYNVNGGMYTGTIALDGERVTISNIPEMNYTIVFTDANNIMFSLGPINVSNNVALSYDTPKIKNATCSDRKNGYIKLPNVVGGISPYRYEWSNLISGTKFDSIGSLSTGVYYVTVTDFAGCIKKDTFELVLDTLRMNLQVIKDAPCTEIKKGEIRITASGGSPWQIGNPYEYSLNGNNWIRFTSPLNLSNIGAGNFTFNVRDTLLCDTNVKTFTMPIDRVIDMNFIKTDILCSGGSDGTVILTANPYSVDYTFLPLVGFPNLGTPKSDTFSITGLPKGNYAYRVIDADACKDTVFFSINEPNPILINEVVVNPGCTTNGSIALHPTGGTGTYMYNWNPIQPGNPDSIGNLTGGTFVVTVTDANSCTSTLSILLNDAGTLDITPELVKPISCAGKNDATIRVDILGSNGPFNISWKDSGGVVIGIAQTLLNIPPGTYTVEVTGSDGCSNIDSLTITEPAPIIFTTSVTNAICSEADGQAVVNVSGNPTGYLFEWTVKNNPVIIDSDNTLIAKAGEYTLTVINPAGCQKDTNIIITSPAPITFPVPDTRNVTCFGLSTGQGAILGGPPNLSYTWSSGTVAPFAINLPTGTNWVIATQGLCTSDTVFFTIGTYPLLTLDQTKTFALNPTCFGDSNGSLTVAATGGTGLGYTYNWNIGQFTPTVSNIGTGSYEVVISDSNNCEYKDTLTLTGPAKLEASVDNVRSVELDCNNQTEGKIALMTTGGNPGIKTYVWQNGVVADKETASGLSAGTYCATVSDNKGCKDTLCHDLMAPVSLKGELNSVAEPLCSGGTTCISVKYLTGGTGNKYTFQLNNGTRYPIDSCVSVFAGVYFINLIDSAGCTIDTIITITQPDQIDVDLGSDMEIQLGLPSPVINALIDSPVALDSLIWTPLTALNCLTSNCQTVELNPSESTTYLLTVTDINGCTGSDDITISVKNLRNVFFANIFSPNRDGNNDYFQPVIGPGVEEVQTFSIFDRWGNLVFEKSNYRPDPTGTDGWDGTFNGQRLDPAVFVYYTSVLFIDGKVIEYSGSVTLADKVRN